MSGVVIYIDAANIVRSAERLGVDVDMCKLIRHLQDSHRTREILYFTANLRSKQREFRALARMSVKFVFKQIYNENGYNKANCDVEIAHRMTCDILLHPPRKIVLVSGDGDFACLCDFAHAKGIEVKVIAFDPSSCSRMIKLREFTKPSFLIDVRARIEKPRYEKPPVGT